MPHVIDVTIPFPSSYFAKTEFFVESAARTVVRDDLRLHRPISLPLGVCNHPIEQSAADALPACIATYVDADLSDTRSASCVRGRCERRPADNRRAVCAGDESPDHQMPGIPNFPNWRIRHEGSQAGRKTFAIDFPDLFPVVFPHVVDREIHVPRPQEQV